jgi:hypothetical protein
MKINEYCYRLFLLLVRLELIVDDLVQSGPPIFVVNEGDRLDPNGLEIVGKYIQLGILPPKGASHLDIGYLGLGSWRNRWDHVTYELTISRYYNSPSTSTYHTPNKDTS